MYKLIYLLIIQNILCINNKDDLYGDVVYSYEYLGLNDRINQRFSEKIFYYFGYCDKIDVWGSLSMSCVVEDIYKYDYPKTTSLISYNSYNPIYITSDYDSGIFSWVENIPTKEGFNVFLIYVDSFI